MSSIDADIRIRNATAAVANANNRVLALGEPGFASDTNSFRIGDGVTPWTTLPAIGGSGVVDWADITGKPATFAPAAHTQAWSTITSTPTTLAGYGIVDGGGSAAWGTITGTLSAQTDLQSALDGKATTAQGALADTALQPGAIGVSVQAFSAVLNATTASFTTADETKLDGVATGATANSSDAVLLARANHTGTQAAATITGLAAVATSGSASDLGAGVLPAARFDDTAHGVRAGGTLHAVAVAAGASGFMTGADKTKLDGIAAGAQVNVPTDLAYTASTRLLTSSTGADVTLPLATTSDAGLAPARSGNAAQYLDGTGVYSTPAGGAGTNLTYTAATRVIASDTGTDATLPLVTTGDAGLAPASGGGTANFLRADGTWAAPAGGGGGGAVTQVTLTAPAGTRGYCEVVVADAGVTAVSKVTASLVPELVAFNDVQGLADNDMKVWAIPQTGSVRFILTGKGPFVGPFKANYEVAA